MSQIITLAFADTFLEAFERLSPQVRKQTRKFIDKFRLDPTQNSINYEPIKQFGNPDLRTVRITQDYGMFACVSYGLSKTSEV